MKKIIATLALVCVVAADTLGQTTADEWFKKAAEYYDKGDYANAVTAYSETIKRDNSNIDAYWFRGFAYYQIKNYDAAIADCNTVINGAPDFPNVYVVRGNAYSVKGVYHKAVADWRTSFEKGFVPSGLDKSIQGYMWCCGALYIEIVINRFLGKSDVVTKYENWLNTVCNNNGVTRAEVEKFYRDNIRALIMALVDGEFTGITIPAGTVSYVKDSLANFCLTPNQNNFNIIKNIYQIINRDLAFAQRIVDANVRDVEVFESLGYKEAAEVARRIVRDGQNDFNEIRRQLNAPNDTPIDWRGLRSAYIKILNGLNTELIRRM